VGGGGDGPPLEVDVLDVDMLGVDVLEAVEAVVAEAAEAPAAAVPVRAREVVVSPYRRRRTTRRGRCNTPSLWTRSHGGHRRCLTRLDWYFTQGPGVVTKFKLMWE